MKESNQRLVSAIAPNLAYNEVLVLDKEKLYQFLYESDFFTKVQVRKD